MFLLNGQSLSVDTPFVANDIQYPANWLRFATEAEKASIGITEVPDPVAYDDRFYWGVDNPKDLDQLKAQWIKTVDQSVWQILNPTDYIDVRNLRDPNYKIDWMLWRESVLNTGKQAKLAIESAKTVEELIPLTSVVFPNDPDHPEVVA